MTTTRIISLATLLLALGMPSGPGAQDEGITIEIDKMTCRERLKMGGDERDFTMIFLLGFVSGRQDAPVFDAPALTAATDRVIDGCIDDPDAALLALFEAARN
jgi:hypothetical protein